MFMFRAPQALCPLQRQNTRGPLYSCSRGCFHDSAARYWTNGLEVDGSEPKAYGLTTREGEDNTFQLPTTLHACSLKEQWVGRSPFPPENPYIRWTQPQDVFCIPSQEDADIDWRVCGQHCFPCFLLGELSVRRKSNYLHLSASQR